MSGLRHLLLARLCNKCKATVQWLIVSQKIGSGVGIKIKLVGNKENLLPW